MKKTIIDLINTFKLSKGLLRDNPEVVNKILIPKIIQRKYPDLSEAEVEEVRQQVVVDSAISAAEITEQGGKKFVRMADKFINIDELSIDLID